MRSFFLRFRSWIVLALGVLLILAVSLTVFTLLMAPPLAELELMALFLSITAAVSTLAAYGAYRLGWLSAWPTLRWTLLAGYALSSLLTFFNVWFSARLMFASQHDLALSVVLLIFAGGIAMVLGYLLSTTVIDRVRLLKDAAGRLAAGHLDTRVPITGRDEISSLAGAFNRMAADLQASSQRQQAAERQRTDLIAWVSHDLQTPLASIRAILEAVADGVVDDPRVIQRYLQTAQKDVRSLSLLIDDLFQMAQLDAGGLQLDLENGSLSDLISDTLESFSELASRQGVTLDGHAAPDLDPVRMDTMRIGRVLNNLVANALRYTPSDGRIQVIASRTGDGVAVSVSDTGRGIDAEDLPQVFNRFYRGEKSRSKSTGGSGLGLAIARGIVRAHHGDLVVKSAPGEGSRFTFTLP
ncbi:MAG: sensor histidine kinase [Anaerolineales bacterium]|jgi:signal transduction histidine kinase